MGDIPLEPFLFFYKELLTRTDLMGIRPGGSGGKGDSQISGRGICGRVTHVGKGSDVNTNRLWIIKTGMHKPVQPNEYGTDHNFVVNLCLASVALFHTVLPIPAIFFVEK
jgi:hypothetical protein